jgi:hypothetical protein
LNFFVKVLKKLPLCEKIPHEKSYLDIVNRNQDIIDLRFMMMQILQWIDSLVHRESNCVGISKLFLICSLLYKII